MVYHAGEHSGYWILVIGAGPAAMALVDQLSKAGHYIVILNRDIKFGGLAEYGIFPSKHKMKEGLRKRYREILARENVEYYGNVPVGNDKALTFPELLSFNASAIIFAAGAQGTKSLGLEGESAQGVIHAKELVYHYNGLPPFSERIFPIGENVAIIGIGNVMVDIAHWLIRYRKIGRVTSIARRGPAERKYDEKEIRHISANIDIETLRAEFNRIRSTLVKAGQEPDQILTEVLNEFTKGEPPSSETRMSFRFLSAPRRVLADAQGRVRAVELEDTQLEAKDSDFVARPLGTTFEFPCDSVVFAVGDRVDEDLGLPYKGGIVPTNPVMNNADGTPAFEVYDEKKGQIIEGVFVVGWCRKASEGLVGIAKRDGDICSEVVRRYLATQSPLGVETTREKAQKLRALILARRPDAVTKSELQMLESIEREMAQQQGLEEFKYRTNQEMLAVIGQRKGQALETTDEPG